ncbi:TonB-dependent receptor [Ferruginibacter sp.]|uniref:TonB-dependent receptor n=1 Tax=Ferruginibacter sp. TaxID=1940288 RepID=UPI002658C3F8|nr:TonB-dependent receptor [Ferruginibacter sp.]
MKQLLNLLGAISISIASFAQSNGKISGTIKEGCNQQILKGASISLLHSSDSSLAKASITDKDGNFFFENINQGIYFLTASYIGRKTVNSKSFVLSADKPTVVVEVLQLLPNDKDLKDVTVISKKAFIERKIDKTVVNVDASVTNAGSTAMDVLEKSPGVTVDKDGNISLKGKQGVMIMLDGKPSFLSGAELANLLRNMSAANLDQIEIMTNPSAKYDAAGNSGIINIKTKKNKQKGMNGSLTLGYGQGVYAKTNNSLNLNYRNGKFNIFSTLSVNQRKNYQHLDIKRVYKNMDQSVTAVFDQNARMLHNNGSNSAKIGVDYYASKKTTIGFVASGFINPEKQTNLNTSYLKNGFGIVDSVAVSTGSEDGSWKNGAINFNLRHQFDSTGREFTMDIDYMDYNAIKTQPFSNITYFPNGTVSNSNQLVGELPSVIKIYSAKADYTHPVKNIVKIETGIKASFVNTDNTAGYFNIINDVKHPDYEKSNRFRYKENINAAYFNASKEIKKWDFQAGLRLENTNYSGNQFGNPQRTDSSFTKSYVGLFPTMFVSYNANEKNQFSFSYGRRINRPAYEDLNPFIFYLDKYTYGEGNPFLRPSYANVLEMSHTFQQWLTTTVNYSHTKDLFSEIFEPRGYATVIKQGNLASADNASISVSAQKPLTKIWTLIVYSEANYSQYKGLTFGNSEKRTGNTYLVNINNQFKFNKGWSAELSGFYRTKGIEGQVSINPLSQVNAGVQKEILKKKGTLKLNIRDAFFSMVQNGKLDILNTDASFHQYGDSRVVSLNFTYRFGKSIKGVQKRKTGGAGDEQNRIKGVN